MSWGLVLFTHSDQKSLTFVPMSPFPTDFWAGSKWISLCPFMSLFALWFFPCYQGNPSTHPPTGKHSIQCKLLSGAIIRLLLKPCWDMSVSHRNFKQVGAETIASIGGLRTRAAGSEGRLPVALLTTSHKNSEQSPQTDRSQDVPVWIKMGRGKRGKCSARAFGLRAAPCVAAVRAERLRVSSVQPTGTCCSTECVVVMEMIVNTPMPRGWQSVLC